VRSFESEQNNETFSNLIQYHANGYLEILSNYFKIEDKKICIFLNSYLKMLVM